MRNRPLHWALAACCAVLACKTSNSGSAVKDDDPPTQQPGTTTGDGTDPAALLASFTPSHWQGNTDPADFHVEGVLSIDTGGGTLTINVNNAPQAQQFTQVRMATDAEMSTYRANIAVNELNSAGTAVDLTQALVLADGSGTLINILPILSPNELYLNPMAILLKSDSGDTAEAETLHCGGIAGIQCPSGFHCGLTANHPDATGVCVKASSQPTPTTPPPPASASKCGGFAGIQCPTNMLCKMSPPRLDGMGLCVAKISSSAPSSGGGSAAGPSTCGGIGGFVCTNGKVCRHQQSGFDTSGVCVDPN